MLYILPLKGVLLILQGIASYLLATSVLMWRDSAKTSSTSMLAWLSVVSDSVGLSIVKMEYLSDDLGGSTDDCLFTATRLQNLTLSFPVSPATLFHCYTRMLLLET